MNNNQKQYEYTVKFGEDQIIAIGSAEECAKITGISASTIYKCEKKKKIKKDYIITRELKDKKKAEIGFNLKYCKDCDFYKPLSESSEHSPRFCAYLLIKKKIRPCGYGDKCIVKENTGTNYSMSEYSPNARKWRAHDKKGMVV